MKYLLILLTTLSLNAMTTILDVTHIGSESHRENIYTLCIDGYKFTYIYGSSPQQMYRSGNKLIIEPQPLRCNNKEK